jgi:hypothetical protein
MKITCRGGFFYPAILAAITIIGIAVLIVWERFYF